MPVGMEKSAIGRLTEREKECLHRWLDHRTAKEIALDLGISPHAVEKRLKMARTKLGVSSSLEAARLLADAEGYQQLGAQSPDLVLGGPGGQAWPIPIWVAGGLVMTFIIAAAVALAVQSSGQASAERTSAATSPSETSSAATDAPMKPGEVRMLTAADMADATPEEIRAFVAEQFRSRDRDHSGFIERDEAPAAAVLMTDAEWKGEGRAPREWFDKQNFRRVPLEPRMAQAASVAKDDDDRDGRVSFAEFERQQARSIDAGRLPKRWLEQHRAHQ